MELPLHFSRANLLDFSTFLTFSFYSVTDVRHCSFPKDGTVVAIFGLSLFWKKSWPKSYHVQSSARLNGKAITNYHFEFKHVQTAPWLMIVYSAVTILFNLQLREISFRS